MKILRLWVLIGIAVGATVFWNEPLLLPLKLLVVLVHEIWHGLAALLSGASIEEIILNHKEAGETLVSNLTGGSGFLFTVSAGYLGSAVSGALLLNRGLAGRYERLSLLAFSGLLFYMCFLFTRPAGTAFFVGLGWSFLLFFGALLGRVVSRYLLIALGAVFIWYCFFDMFDFTRNMAGTDAGILAEYMKTHAWFGLGATSDSLAVGTVISITWCILMALAIYRSVSPFIRPTPAAPEPESAPAEPPPEEFPGEVTPEIEIWLLKNGLGSDGKPLPQEILDLRNSLPAKNSVQNQG